MSGRHTRLGYLVFQKPAEAGAELQRLFAEHRSLAAVAAAEGVDRMTIRRWLSVLAAAKVTVKRPTVVGGRPRVAKA